MAEERSISVPSFAWTFTTVLLDIDGTLLLSNDAHARAWQDAFAESGFDVPLPSLVRLIGMGGDKLVRAIDPNLRIEQPPASIIAKRRAEIFRERYLATVSPSPGARRLVETFIANGFTCVVATSATAAELKLLLRAAHVDDLIGIAATSDDAGNSKPDPDIIGAALQRANAQPVNAVLLGDTPYDLQAAQKAGVKMIAVRCGGWPDDALAGALAIYDDPATLVRDFDESPFTVEKPAPTT